MAGGSYLGGSSLIRTFGTTKKKPNLVGKGGGLLAREVSYRKTGTASDTPLLAPIAKPKNHTPRKKRVSLLTSPSSSPTRKQAQPRPVNQPIEIETANDYLLKYHSTVPGSSRKVLVKALKNGSWINLTMEQALRRCADLHATYDLCGLLRITQAGVSKEEASKMIQPQIKRILEIWEF